MYSLPNPNKLNIKEIEKEINEDIDLSLFEESEGQSNLSDGEKSSNMLVRGDNLKVLWKLRNRDLDIDLVYADPPFATGREFNSGNGDYVNQFSDKGETAYSDEELGSEYLLSLSKRLVLIKDILSERGSVYIHIDNDKEPYIKILMDEIFGEENHLNTITRIKCNPKNFSRKAYGNITDKILFYTKNKEHIWNKPRQEYTKDQLDRLFSKEDEDGRKFTTTPLHAPGETDKGETGQEWKGMKPPDGRHWRYPPKELTELDNKGLIYWSSNGNPRKKRYADESDGPKRQDVWKFKDPQKKEYPTQKNTEMLKTIIKASSEKNSTLLDPYCGSGNILSIAQELGRSFVGIDASEDAIEVSKNNLEDKYYNYYQLSK